MKKDFDLEKFDWAWPLREIKNKRNEMIASFFVLVNLAKY